MLSEEWLAKLIAFNTTSRYSNLPLIEYVGSWLKHLDIPIRLSYDTTGMKANLFATIPGQTEEGGLILSGHTDVVPVDGQAWNTDPFQATKIGNRIYGRGTCDMKGFLSVVLSLIPNFQKMNLKQPLYLALTYDEEVGCLGAPSLIDDFLKFGVRPSACIVGEPTEMVPVVGHKGINSFCCRLHGHAAHSSLTPKGCNSIEHGAKLICRLRDLADQLKLGLQDTFFDVPFSTLTTNMISGGIAMNTIPDLLEFLFEFRNLPQTNCDDIVLKIKSFIDEELLPAMRNESPGASIQLERKSGVPAFQASEEAKFTQAVREISNEKQIRKVSYATEAGLFQQAGIHTIVCGPGSIQEAHKPNEFVTVEQLEKCDIFLREIVKTQSFSL